MRAIQLLISVVIYAIFFATFLYLIGFTVDLPMLPITVDRGPAAPLGEALAIDTLLIAAFGIQHSVMARQGFKRLWTRIVPPAMERSVYVLAASIMLHILFVGWRPITTPLWSVGGSAALVLWGVNALGWAMVLLSTFLLNHFELFGLAQAYRALADRRAADPAFHTPLLYRLVRHPLYLGFFIAFWATPVMTVGHLVLALGMSVYTLIAIGYEERDLVAAFGDQYRAYQARVGMLVPGLGKTRG
ncbi:methanethiol S-methyltransferase [Sphingomonas sp. GlSt437]|uniref:methanethiol S-methyltransferase n=1 Tax=Sphingomonas sp. GlSt437 TaxID=3389970 RepID=UPI003A896DD1